MACCGTSYGPGPEAGEEPISPPAGARRPAAEHPPNGSGPAAGPALAVAMRTAIHSDNAPAAVGPYSQAVKANGFVFCSGQLGVDPDSGEFVPGGIAEQTEQVLQNLNAVLGAAGSGLDLVVKATVFLKDMNDFAAMNEVYKKHIAMTPPARSTVQVARLPKDALVEIEAIALVE